MALEDSGADSIATRRQLLKVTGAGLATVGLAGCSSDEGTVTDGSEDTDSSDESGGSTDTDGDTTESTSGGEPIDSVYTLASTPDVARKDIGFNIFNSDSKSIRIQSMLSENLMALDNESGEFIPRIIESATVEGGTMTAKVNTDYGWSNGDPISPKDIETQVTMELGHGYSVGDLVESVSAVDDETVEFTLKGPSNPEIVKQRTFLRPMRIPHQVYSEYAQAFKDAESESEQKTVQKDVQGLSINFDENTDKLITSGPLKYSDVNNKRVMLTPNENHPRSEAINFDGVEFLWVKDASSAQSLLKSGRLDAQLADMSQSFIDSLPSHHETYNIEEFGGNSIDFYLQDELYGDVRVRKAFNYLLDQQRMTKASDFVATPVKYFAGTPDFLAEQYVPQETLDQFPQYKRDPQKAASLLRDAGFTKQGGKWYKPDGNQWKPQLSVASGSTGRIKELRVASAQLKNAGVQAEIDVTESATYWKSIRQRDYNIATYAWGDRGNRHPYFDYTYMWIGQAFNDQDEAWNGLPNEVEVPGTVGDPDSSKETWNIQEMTTELGQTNDTDRQQELITQLAWMYNQHVVKLPINHTTAASVVTRDEWQLPSTDSLDSQRDTPRNLLRKGKLQAKTE